MSPGMSAQNSDEASQPPEKVVEVFLGELLDPQKKEEALLHLDKRIYSVPDFGLLIWYTPCIITLLLQEIIRIYPFIGNPNYAIPRCDSIRICNVLSLLQVVAADTRVRSNFLEANIPQYLYPFMLAECKSSSIEFLRLSSLGVIGYLFKDADMNVILFLIKSEIVPACLRSMDVGSELSKTAATLIMKTILSTEFGLSYMCDKTDRFFAMNKVLVSMVKSTEEILTARLLKHVISCYLFVSKHPRVSEYLYEALPDEMKDGTIRRIFQDDPQATEALNELFGNIEKRHCPNGNGNGKGKGKGEDKVKV